MSEKERERVSWLCWEAINHGYPLGIQTRPDWTCVRVQVTNAALPNRETLSQGSRNGQSIPPPQA